MHYISTRAAGNQKSASQAILQGISEEGGLFVPSSLPTLSRQDLAALCGADYSTRALWVLSAFLPGFSRGEIWELVRGAYTGGRFENDLPAPLAKLSDGAYLLELWHGPTCAFKDMALQLLPRLMPACAKKEGLAAEIIILVATSGDTGKAALEGFRDVPGTRILVFYPQDGVSAMQKLQMQAQQGQNVAVCAIEGNFDDAQAGVKKMFTSPALSARLRAANLRFSSANSINWGRLLPQIAYYVSAYCSLVADEEIAFGDQVNVAVPTGNFGNILAAYYAKAMGVPLGRLLCASNRNNVLTDFIETGAYESNRGFYPTLSPSMDILISSNLERLLFEASGRDENLVRTLMDTLAKTGRYEVPAPLRESIQTDFSGGYCTDGETKAAIRRVYEEYCYLLDTHTAVAYKVYEDYVRRTGDDTKTIVVSTASPYKFPGSVCDALGVPYERDDPFSALEALHGATHCPVPAPLAALRGQSPRFTDVCGPGEMESYTCARLGL